MELGTCLESNEEIKTCQLFPAFQGDTRGPKHSGKVNGQDGPKRNEAALFKLKGSMLSKGVKGGF